MGFILLAAFFASACKCVAMLQFPFFHLLAGSGKIMQYFSERYSVTLWQPSHLSIIGWQLPPINWHPFLLIKTHSEPFLTVVQTMITTSFLLNSFSLEM